MHQVVLVVQTQDIHDDINAQAESHLSLPISTRSDLVAPPAEGVSRPGPGEIVLTVDNRVPFLEEDPLKVRHPKNPSGLVIDQVEGFEENVLVGDPQ